LYSIEVGDLLLTAGSVTTQRMQDDVTPVDTSRGSSERTAQTLAWFISSDGYLKAV